MKVFEGYRKYGILGYFTAALGFFLTYLSKWFSFLMILGIILIGYGWYEVGDVENIDTAKINGLILMLMILTVFIGPFFVVASGNLHNIVYIFYILIAIGVISAIVNIATHFRVARKENIKYFEYSAYLRIICMVLSVTVFLDLINKLSHFRNLKELLNILNSGYNIWFGIILLLYGIAYTLTVYGWTKLGENQSKSNND